MGRSNLEHGNAWAVRVTTSPMPCKITLPPPPTNSLPALPLCPCARMRSMLHWRNWENPRTLLCGQSQPAAAQLPRGICVPDGLGTLSDQPGSGAALGNNGGETGCGTSACTHLSREGVKGTRNMFPQGWRQLWIILSAPAALQRMRIVP